MPKIIIMGAGIAGLTVAHELIQFTHSDYDIHIYERNKIIGGMARSRLKHKNGKIFPTEYSWRIYGPNYFNLRNILKKIPLMHDSSMNVHDNLVDISNFLISDSDVVFNMTNRPSTLITLRHAFSKVPFTQKINVLSKILYCFMISTERLNNLDNITWSKYINPDNSLSHDIKKYIIDIMGPYLGAEPTKVNVPSVVKTLESFKLLNKPLSVMNAPTNEAWFDHWQTYLESKGVKFHFESEIVDLSEDNGTIQHCTLADKSIISADIYFCSMPVESVAKIKSVHIHQIKELARRSYQLMMGIQLYFEHEIKLPLKNTAMYIPDSPWQLVIEPQGSIWGKKYDGFSDIWSIGLCDPDRPGLSIQKKFTKCSHKEIYMEVWYQIINSELNKYLQLELVRPIEYNVWDSYIFNGENLETYEPKFSTNKGTYFLRPDNQSEYQNMYFATAYTKTDTDMFEMESAAESGKRAAKLLENTIHVAGCDRPAFFSTFRFIDRIFSRLNIYKKKTLFWFLLGFLPSFIMFPLILLWRLIKRSFLKYCSN